MKLRVLLAIVFALVLSGKVFAAEGEMGVVSDETTTNSMNAMIPANDENAGDDESAAMPEEVQQPEEVAAPAGAVEK